VRTGARNRIARVVHRFPTVQQVQAFVDSDELRAAMTGAGIELSADRIELAVEA
jgi:hypothetical protein